MAFDRHRLWRMVEHDYAQLEKLAPEGYTVACEVFLAGRQDPIEVAFVETNRSPDIPWVRFQCRDPADDRVGLTDTDYWVLVHENAVLRAELSFRSGSKRGPIGFGQSTTDESSDLDAE